MGNNLDILEWVKQTVVCPFREYYSLIKRSNLPINEKNLDEARGHYSKKKYMLYDPIDIMFWKWQNYSCGREISGCQDLRTRWGRQWKGFRKDLYWDWTVLSVDCININILYWCSISILYTDIVLHSVTIGRNWVKSTLDVSVYLSLNWYSDSTRAL